MKYNNNNKIYIFGHKNPDSDSVISSIALSHLKNMLGFNTEPVLLGPLNKETEFILKKFNINYPKILEELNENDKVILVDHNELSQSYSQLNESQIIEIVDHHKLGILTSSPISITIRPVGSTCSIISKLYDYYKIDIPKSIVHLLLCGIISDTLLFKSPTCTSFDIDESKKLKNILNLNENEIKSLGLEIFKAGSNINNLSIEELIYNDFKEITLNNKKVGISQLLLLDPSILLNKKCDFINYIKESRTKNNYILFLLLITDILNDGSYIFFDTENIELINKLFNHSCIQGSFIKNLVSRKKQILPKLSTLI